MGQQLDFSHFSKEDKIEIGNRISTQRLQIGMTLEKLSEITGIDPRVISRHENGQLCNVEALIKYALVFETYIENLLPVKIASRIRCGTEEEEKYWRMLDELSDVQRKAVYHLISVMVPQTA